MLLIIAGVTKSPVGPAVAKLDRLNKDVMVVGLGLLTVGTLLGGVWANESWGRYWGWDPKETWSLVSILVYALILHFRWIPAVQRLRARGGVVPRHLDDHHDLLRRELPAGGPAQLRRGRGHQIPTWVVVSFVGC